MRNRIFTSVIILVGLFTTYAWAQSVKPTVVGQKVSLSSGDSTITYVELTNTHSRSIRLEYSDHKLTVEEHIKGVIWKIQCIGIKMEDPFEKIILKNEKGQIFKPVSGTITTIGRTTTNDEKGNILYDGPATVFYWIGPDNSKAVQIIFGDASVKLNVIK